MRRQARVAAAGFTLVEMLVAVILSGILLTALVSLMLVQFRGYSQQLASADVSETLRGAGALIGWEARHAGVASEVIMSTSQDTLSLRSVQGVGVICARDSTTGRYGIWRQGGDIQATANDSALVYNPASQQWSRLKITQVGTPGAMGLAQCAWEEDPPRPPDLVVEVVGGTPADTAGIAIGSMFRSFRRTRFAQIQLDGRWWLGRQVGTGSWERITGPLLAPGAGGLRFTYFDSTGVATTGASTVRMIGIAIRSESFRRFRTPMGTARFRQDSLITRVMLRY